MLLQAEESIILFFNGTPGTLWPTSTLSQANHHRSSMLKEILME
jgi:hypothetical protein